MDKAPRRQYNARSSPTPPAVIFAHVASLTGNLFSSLPRLGAAAILWSAILGPGCSNNSSSSPPPPSSVVFSPATATLNNPTASGETTSGRRVLFGFNYLYDAQCGQVGFQPA